MKRTLHILFAAFAAMILLPAAMMAQDDEGIRCSITDGTLFIGGSGPMDNYGTYGECPWYESIVYGDDGVIEVTEIIIEEGVTHIGDYAFEDANAVTSVTLPSTLESIGMHAFAFMSSLTEITIPKNVAFIDELAFTNCDNLCSITLTSSAAPELGDQAFGGCEKLKAIYVNGAPDDYMDWTGTYEYPVSLNTSEASLEIADAEFDVKDYIIGIKNVEELTYTRTLPNTLWNALYVPIEIPVASLSANYDVAYINDIHSSDDDQDGVIDAMEMEVIKISSGTLKANYPYLIRAKSDAAKAVNLVLEDVELFPARKNYIDCSSVFTDFTIWGTYRDMQVEDMEGRYAISTTGAWQELAEGTTLKPCRLYLEMYERGGSPVKVEAAAEIRIRVAGEDSEVTGGEATDIEEVGAADAEENVIFDLMGRRVAAPVKGQIYIVNGKKVLF